MVLSSLVRFADNTAGLEKSLRLLQSLCTIAIGVWVEDFEFWTKARGQFALGRRYFRLLKWHPCWANAFSAFGQDRNPAESLLDIGKWSFLGLYFFLEMFTISNAMGLTAYEWGPKVQQEANKCWFYGLVFSVLLSLYQLASPKPLSATEANVTVNEIKNEQIQETTAKSKKPKNTTRSIDPKLLAQLVIDGCDLFIPGAAVGWIPVGMLTVGTASTISTTVAGHQIWNSVQQTAQRT